MPSARMPSGISVGPLGSCGGAASRGSPHGTGPETPDGHLAWRRGALISRGRRVLLVCTLLSASAFVVASAVLFVWPATNRPAKVDAIVSLDGTHEKAREDLAISLAEHGYATVLIFSQGAYHTTPCPKVPRVRVVCFVPRPARTVGEVEFAARYALRRGWRSLLVVPGRAQSTRARLLMDRCFGGRVLVVPAPVPWQDMPYEVLYEWGATAKAILVDPGC